MGRHSRGISLAITVSFRQLCLQISLNTSFLFVQVLSSLNLDSYPDSELSFAFKRRSGPFLVFVHIDLLVIFQKRSWIKAHFLLCSCWCIETTASAFFVLNTVFSQESTWPSFAASGVWGWLYINFGQHLKGSIHITPALLIRWRFCHKNLSL